ncbi:MAG: hypothetical protein EOM14_13430, partial [Clostridia bacterium]|nr:hypothetical protein [Clostridia bacterium]
MQTGKSSFLRAALFGLCLLIFPHMASAATIENVSVRVIDSSGLTSTALLQRMTASMQVVAEQLFLEKDSAQLEIVKSDYAR